MMWTYRVFCDRQGRYSIREVFYDRDNTILNYGKTPVAVVGASVEELIQLVQWFKEAFDLPVLSLETVEAQLAQPKPNQLAAQGRNSSLQQVMAELAADVDSVSSV